MNAYLPTEKEQLLNTKPMIPYSGPTLVAAPPAPYSRSWAQEAFAGLGRVFPHFGRRWLRQTKHLCGNSLIAVLFLPALCLTVVSQTKAVSVSGQIGPDSVATGKSPFVDTWNDMVARDQYKLTHRSGVPQVEDVPLRILENQRRPSLEDAMATNAPLGRLEPFQEAPQALGTSFVGISLQDQFSAFGTGSIPPDTMGAVGPNHFMEVINSSVAIYNKTGTRLSHVSLDSFFTASFSGTTYPRNGSFDPRVLYDRRSGRWFAIVLERGNPSGTQNHVILAVSASSDPTGSWYKYLIAVGVPSGTYTYFSDFDTLGTDDNGVYVAVRIFPSTGSTYAKIAAMPKTSLLSGTASTVSFFTSITDMWSTPQPAHNQDPVSSSGSAWFVSSSTTVYANVNYRRLTWSGGTPSLDSSSSAATTPAYGGDPLNAPALGSTTAINVGDDRLQMAVIRGTNLWTCRAVGLDSSGGSGTATRTGCEWLQLALTTGSATLVQSGRVYDSAASNPRYYYYPSIMVNGQGHAAMGFSGSSSTEYVGSYFTGRLSGEAAGTMGSIVQIKAGQASYLQLDSSSRNRWGDYSYTSLDPNDDMSLWTIQEYASSTANIWGTWVARLQAPPPATPISCSPASVQQGQANVNVTLSGTTISGSGFFDPGTGFPNRLTAVVNGGGVTVNSVTFSSPTTITINATIAAGATIGARTITVTNPDGQTATSASGILTVTSGTISVTVQPSQAGRSFTVDGTSYTTSQTFSWIPGSSHTIATTSPQSGGTGVQYVWTAWSDGGALSHTVAPTVPTTYTANFKTQYYLTMAAGAGGTVSPASGWYDASQVVSISASASAGYSFASWTGSGTGSYSGASNPVNVTMSAPITETARFNILVTVQPSLPGRTFTVDGTSYSAAQILSWVPGSTHTIATTSPQSGGTGVQYVWTAWSDGGALSHTVAPTVPTTYTANFKTQYYLTMAAGAGGTVSPASGWYDASQVVSISASASAGYSFASWTGSGTGSYSGVNNPASVTMNAPITETAAFNIQVTVQPSLSGRTFTVDGTSYSAAQTLSWVPGSTHTIATTSPQSGGTGVQYVWAAWSDGGALSHTVAPTVPTTYTANFKTQYYMTMAAGAGGTVSPASGWYDASQVVSISASASAGYIFASWTGSGAGSYSGVSNPVNITMNGAITETAGFNPTSGVTIQTIPSGRAFTVDGTNYSSTQTFTNWPVGSTHTIATTSPQSGGTGTQYVWTGWSDGGVLSHTIVKAANATNYTANFKTQYYLTMVAGTGGTVSPASGWYDASQNVSISASPNSAYCLGSWAGSGLGSYSGVNNPAGVVMNGPITETFAFNLSVTVQTITAGRTFAVDGTSYGSSQSFCWTPGSSHTIAVASPQSGGTGTQYVWTAWSDGGAASHTVAPTVPTTYTASFKTQHYITMVAGTGGTVSPASGWYDASSAVSISASPNAGYAFTNWTGSGTGSYSGLNNPATVTMSGAISETAAFIVPTPPPSNAFVTGMVLGTLRNDYSGWVGMQIVVGANPLTVTNLGRMMVLGNSGTHTVKLVRAGDGLDVGSAVVTMSGGTVSNFQYASLSSPVTLAANTAYYVLSQEVAGGDRWGDMWDTVVTTTPVAVVPGVAWGTGPGAYNTYPLAGHCFVPVGFRYTTNPPPPVAVVQTSPSGRAITVDGTNYTSPQSFAWTPGSSHTLAVTSPQSGGTGTQHVWTAWSDGQALSHTIVVPNSNVTYTASFKTQYYLTNVAGTGGTVSPASGWNDAGQALQINAVAGAGYSFSGWTGSGTGSYSGMNNPASVMMNGAITEVAAFVTNTPPPGTNFVTSVVPGTLRNDWSGWAGMQIVVGSSPVTVSSLGRMMAPGNSGAHTVKLLQVSGTVGTDVPNGSVAIAMSGGTVGQFRYGALSSAVTLAAGATYWVLSQETAGGDSWYDWNTKVTTTGVATDNAVAWGTGPGAWNTFAVANQSFVPVDFKYGGPPPPTNTLTVTSSNPNSGVSVLVSPADNGGLGNGATTFTRKYNSSTVVTLTAAATAGGNSFQKWQRDGADWSTSLSTTVTMDTNRTMTAVYYPPIPRTLTVASANPTGGVSITASPNDSNGQGSGVTAFSRIYSNNTVVTLTAPATAGGNSFQKWQRDGTDWSTSLSTTVTMDANRTMTAVYSPISGTSYVTTVVLGTLRNDYSGWVGMQIVVGAAPLTVTNLGRMMAPGNSGTHTLMLSDRTNSLGSVSVSMVGGTAGQFKYGTLGTPVTLAAGRTYWVLSQETLGGDNWYDMDTKVTTRPDATDNAVVWSPGTGVWNTYAVTNQCFVPVNFLYGTNPPPPTIVQTSPSGRTFTVDGTTYSSAQSFTWTPGSSHTIGTTSPQSGGSGVQSVWTGWSDGGAISHTVSPPIGGATYTANFKTQYYLTNTAGPGGTVSPASGWYDASQTVPITALASNGYSFDSWAGVGSGSYSGANNPASVTLIGPIAETATFTPGDRFVTNTVLGTLRNDYSGWLGMQIVVGTNPLTVKSLGRMMAPGNSGTHTVKLLRAGGANEQLGAVSVAMSGGTVGQFQYASLSSPVTLAAGTTNWVLSQETAYADKWYDWDTKVETRPHAADNAIVWGTGSSAWNTFAVANQAFVPVDFIYGTTPQVIVRTSPSGRAFTVDGASYSSPQTFNWPPGSSHTIGVSSPQSFGSGTQFVWTAWSDGGAMSHSVEAPANGGTYTATFKAQYYLTMRAEPSSGGTVSPASGWCDAGLNVQISASPSAGLTFGGWTGVGSGSYTGMNNPANVTINGAITNTATFRSGGVTVETSPPGLTFTVDGTSYNSRQTFTNWTQGASHTIGVSSPQSGGSGTQFVWTAWSDGGTNSHTIVTPTGSTNYIATFKTQYYLTMIGESGGTVSPASGWYDAGQGVQINASPSSGYVFINWIGSGTGSYSGVSNPANVTMNGAITETARFDGGGTPYVTGSVLGTMRNDWSGWAGMQIVVGSSPITVRSLGRMMAPGNSSTHSIMLVKANTGQTNGSVSVSMSGGTVGKFRYGTLNSPVTLAAGTAYWVLSQETAGGDNWYDWNTKVTTTPVAADNAVAWGTGSGSWNTFTVANQSFVPVDFIYDPAPPQLVPYVKATNVVVGTLRNDYSGWLGLQIVVGADPVVVRQLGRFMASGNSGAHTVRLLQANGTVGTELASVAVAMSGGTVGDFQYASLSSPVTLATGTTYWILSQETAGGDKWYDWDTRFTTTAVAAANAVTWGTGPGAWNIHPVSGQSFIPVNFKYEGSSGALVSLSGKAPLLSGESHIGAGGPTGANVTVFLGTDLIRSQQIVLHIPGQAGGRYIVESSDDLINWSALCGAIVEGGVIELQDISAPGSNRRFYRLSPAPGQSEE